MNAQYNFGPAAPDESLVYGAERPGFQQATPDDDVQNWITFMQERDIERVCCLLKKKLQRYDDLLGEYRTAFGEANVLHAPNPDHAPLDVDLFADEILPFLRVGATNDQRTVVHCSAGIGRTGQVLVGWLCCERDYGHEQALEIVEKGGDGYWRRPLEGPTTDTDHLCRLCDACD